MNVTIIKATNGYITASGDGLSPIQSDGTRVYKDYELKDMAWDILSNVFHTSDTDVTITIERRDDAHRDTAELSQGDITP